MFERRSQRVLPPAHFVRRMALFAGIAGALIVAALMIGMAGYHWLAGLSWIDALLNAAMILTGMGPVDALHSTGAKVFAAAYALFSGLMFITVMGVVFAPMAHRILHKFHMDGGDGEPHERKET